MVLIGLSDGAPEPCISSRAAFQESQTAQLEVGNLTFTIRPKAGSNGPVYNGANFALSLLGFQELSRYNICYEASPVFPVPPAQGSGVVPLLYLSPDELMCDYRNELWDTGQGVIINTTHVILTWPLYPNFSAVLNASVANADVSILRYYSPSQNLSYYDNYKYVSRTGM